MQQGNRLRQTVSVRCWSLDRETVEAVIRNLADYYAYEKRGIRIVRLEDSYQMCSAPEQAERIRLALETRKPPQLSQPALESLAVIAYFQPATRAFVEQMRGVDSAYTVNLLAERGLIEEAGRLVSARTSGFVSDDKIVPALFWIVQPGGVAASAGQRGKRTADYGVGTGGRAAEAGTGNGGGLR